MVKNNFSFLKLPVNTVKIRLRRARQMQKVREKPKTMLPAVFQR